MVKKGLVLVVLLSLVACANQYDAEMYKYYADAEIQVAQAKSNLGIAQANAIGATITEDSTDLERYLARNQIAGLVVTPSGIKSATTGNDVLITVAEDGSTIVRDIITGTVLFRGIVGLENIAKSSGTTTVQATEGSTVNYTNKDQKAVSAQGNATVGDSTPEATEATVEGNGCPEDKPVFYEGTCYSEGSAEERGFPID